MNHEPRLSKNICAKYRFCEMGFSTGSLGFRNNSNEIANTRKNR